MRKNEGLSVHRQCELLGITRSTVYYETKQPDREALKLKEEIMARIDYWHTVLPCMGTRKLAVKLREEGYEVGRKLVRSCIQEMGIHAVYPEPNLSKRSFKETIVPYLLRNEVISFPNKAWSIDITYIKMQHGHMYLTAIIDWFSRKILLLNGIIGKDKIWYAVQEGTLSLICRFEWVGTILTVTVNFSLNRAIFSYFVSQK